MGLFQIKRIDRNPPTVSIAGLLRQLFNCFRRPLSFSVLLIICSGVYAQTITVLSARDNEPLPFTHIVCKTMDSQKEHVFLTDSSGKADISQLITTSAKIRISLFRIGYKQISDTLISIQNKTYYLSPENTTLNEVVVTAQYAPNSPEKAVHKIKIIDSKKIETMAAQNLRDVLSNEMNIRLSQDNILGSSMSLQGISGQNIKILIDGVPLTGRLNGNIDISQINMNNVERIEIIEGPLSVNYGTDALGGTINIITKKTQKETFAVSSNNYYESNGQYNFNGKLGYNKGKNLISLSGGRNYFDGWRTNDKAFHVERKGPADSSRYQDWKPKEQYFGTLHYARNMGKLQWGYTGDYFFEQVANKGLPRIPYYESAFDDYYNTYRINNVLNLSGQLNKKYYTNILLAYNHFQRIKNTYYKDLTTLEQALTANQGDQDTTVFNNIMTRGSISTSRESAKLNYEIGYDINHETGLGLRVKNGIQQIGDYAIFSSAEYKPISKLTIRPGLRIIYNTAYNAPLIPSLNFKYFVGNNERKGAAYTIRFSYGKGFRSPSLKELYFYFVDINHNITGNENLKAEQSHNLNFTVSRNGTKGNTIIKTEASFFYNYIENMISLAQASNTQFSYFNMDQFETVGFQLSNDFAWQHFKISVGGAYIGRYNQLSQEYTSDPFSYSPEGRCNLFYEWQKQNITFGLFYKYTGKLPGFGMSSENEVYQTEIQNYHTADLSISKLFFNKRINLSGGVKNIFDIRNITGTATGGGHLSASNTIALGMGRTFFVKLGIDINPKK